MLISSLGVHQIIIDELYDEFIKAILEHLIYQVYKDW